LEELEIALAESTAANQAATLRAAEIRELLDAGMSVSEIVLLEQPPLIVELTSDNVKRLYNAGGTLRRLEALVLHEEGMTMDTIARLFGVTRQRVSALINDARS
jgi:predicted transcriptional regulator